MALCQVHFFSQVLQKQAAMNVIVPDSGNGPFATFYLLHGLSDDYTIWNRRTRVEVYAERYPLIVAMPDGFRGFYTDNENGPDYGKYIGQEIPSIVERMFPARSDRGGRCIGGLSMGGYGAMRAALTYPDRYASANSHSGSVMVGTKNFAGPQWRERRMIFGAKPGGSKHDLLSLAAKITPAKLPRLLIDCGTEDQLLQDNRAFHAGLEKLKRPHEYREFPGAHDWSYWETHVQDALEFHAAAMNLKSQ